MAVGDRTQAGWRILFVDDEPQIVDSISRILTHLGFQVAGHTSGSAAIDAFREAPDSFDAVVTDLTMPSMNGIALARALNALREHLPVIRCSGYGDPFEQEIEASDYAIRVFLRKPVSAAALRQAIEEVLADKQKQR